MGEIADSLISGEFDCITGEYLGDARWLSKNLCT